MDVLLQRCGIFGRVDPCHSSLPGRVQLLEPEGPWRQGGAVSLAGEEPDLAGEAHHGSLDVQVGEVDGLGFVSRPVVESRGWFGNLEDWSIFEIRTRTVPIEAIALFLLIG